MFIWQPVSLGVQSSFSQRSKLIKEKNMLSIKTKGTSYEIGRQYGEKTRELLKEFVETTVNKIRSKYKSDPIEKAFQVMLNILEKDFSYLIEEMRGMAEGAKLDFKDVALANLRGGLGIFIEPDEGCSNIIFYKSDHGPILGKTLDGSKPESDTGVVRFIEYQNGRKILCETRIGGILTETGINDRGLAVGESSLHFYTVNPKGIIRNILPRLILEECTNVEEGIQFLSRYPVLRFGFHFALVDKTGNAAIVERSPTEMYVRRGNDQIIYCTNHTATPCMRKLEKSRGPTGDKNSDERYANLTRITSNSNFKMTLDNMKGILQNHRVPGGICQHGDLEMYTHRAYISVPAEGKLLVAAGTPCRNEFQEFGL
jgi:isopenicillin-N N-acyltransferase-like protein